jgi:RsgA GTPase
VEACEQAEQLTTGAGGRAAGRGKHTTRNIKFLEMARGGLLADTPGFNLPVLDSVELSDLPSCFPEIRRRLEADRWLSEEAIGVAEHPPPNTHTHTCTHARAHASV